MEREGQKSPLHSHDLPCTIVKLGLNLELVSCFFLISRPILSLIFFAIAVPSIFSATILLRVVENNRKFARGCNADLKAGAQSNVNLPLD